MFTKIFFFALYRGIQKNRFERNEKGFFLSLLKKLGIYLLFYSSTKGFDSSILLVNSKKANSWLGLRSLFGS